MHLDSGLFQCLLHCIVHSLVVETAHLQQYPECISTSVYHYQYTQCTCTPAGSTSSLLKREFLNHARSAQSYVTKYQMSLTPLTLLLPKYIVFTLWYKALLTLVETDLGVSWWLNNDDLFTTETNLEESLDAAVDVNTGPIHHHFTTTWYIPHTHTHTHHHFTTTWHTTTNAK